MTECEYCNNQINSDVVSDEVAAIDHYLFECEEIPSEVRDWYNGPPQERKLDEKPEVITNDF